MADVLLEEVGPNRNVQAVVEVDDATCYLYLHFAEDTGLAEEVRSVWVRNLAAAPEFVDAARMRAGLAPRNLASYCKFPQGGFRRSPFQHMAYILTMRKTFLPKSIHPVAHRQPTPDGRQRLRVMGDSAWRLRPSRQTLREDLHPPEARKKRLAAS